MSSAGIALRQISFEQKSFWRNPASAFFAFLFPIIFLVVFATLFKGQQVLVGSTRTSYDDYYIPALIAFGVMGACFTNIAVTLSLRRDNGILKRLRGTPLPPWAFIAGVVGSSIIVSIVLALLTTVFGILVYGVHVPQHIVAAAASIVVGPRADRRVFPGAQFHHRDVHGVRPCAPVRERIQWDRPADHGGVGRGRGGALRLAIPLGTTQVRSGKPRQAVPAADSFRVCTPARTSASSSLVPP